MYRSSEIEAIVNKHNEYRKMEGASNMEYMVRSFLKLIILVENTLGPLYMSKITSPW